ncbi:LacI family DNA-binding transcriptional regulator [Kutzneria kofuensis]|uniref:DNA-binding LacI/PurR family transcriptional regulator n=1 Tax=Kutzneria kofuensis TaxID=103725 RepID=A0A7W9KP40_9PSEU|nr:LacI family DNA-binding transcriptional regulator [Kutzneria kofuensis]MBB5896126.1 DNA-binding LacI/PurR family transcriptional regulator [Kutzneria kofuensis]
MTAVEPCPASPTLADVARAAGVSLATASRVLNRVPLVRAETRRQVESAIAALGYRRQRAARSAPPARTRSIALVVCEEGLRLFTDPYFARIVAGISREVTAAEVQLVLLTVPSTKDSQVPAMHYLGSGPVDGALFVSMHGRSPLNVGRIGVPVVVGGQPMHGNDINQVSYVDVDNHGGAVRAVRHLIDSGRSMIATVAGPRDMTAGFDRLAGYRRVMADAERSDHGLVYFGDFSQASGEHATVRLLERRPHVDAIFAASDLMAVGVLRALRRAGRRVPDDVAVIGFDDLPVGRHTDPPLTTVRQPTEELGARMVRELLGLMDDSSAPQCGVVLDTELVPRASA